MSVVKQSYINELLICKATEKKQSNSWNCLMAGHTLKIRAVDTIIDTIKETQI